MPSRGIAGKRLERALADLAHADADMARAIDEVGPPPPRWSPPGFATLMEIILAQQISRASADAIWRRLNEAAAPLTPESFLALDDGALRAIGFSRQKVVYGRSLAELVGGGDVRLDELAARSDAEVIASLTRVKGIGRWTAEIYLMFCLGRPDVLPAGDLALLTAAQRVKRLRRRPTPGKLRQIGERWRPWRSVASRLLWHYYRHAPLSD
jgi:DNA-3-methyladenine glycosylase II